jgi:hypothetical protein
MINLSIEFAKLLNELCQFIPWGQAPQADRFLELAEAICQMDPRDEEEVFSAAKAWISHPAGSPFLGDINEVPLIPSLDIRIGK